MNWKFKSFFFKGKVTKQDFAHSLLHNHLIPVWTYFASFFYTNTQLWKEKKLNRWEVWIQRGEANIIQLKPISLSWIIILHASYVTPKLSSLLSIHFLLTVVRICRRSRQFLLENQFLDSCDFAPDNGRRDMMLMAWGFKGITFMVPL